MDRRDPECPEWRTRSRQLLCSGRADRRADGADVLTLQNVQDDLGDAQGRRNGAGGTAVATAPPRVRLVDEIEFDEYARKRRTLVIRHASGDRIVALVELVSPGNKSTRAALGSFVDKAVEALRQGYHLLIVDLFPPGPRDPRGIHGAIRDELGPSTFSLPEGEPLTLAAYSAGRPVRAYIEPTAVGRVLIDMPLFLEPESYVNVPFESTYLAAYRGVPGRWKRVLDERAGPPS